MNCNYFRCTQRCDSIELFLEHLFVHSKDPHFIIKCQFCGTNLDSYEKMKKHMKKNHIFRIDHFQVHNLPEIYICNHLLCSAEEFKTRPDLISHLHQHCMLNNSELKCIYKNCNYETPNIPNVRSPPNYANHLNRLHKNSTFLNVQDLYKKDQSTNQNYIPNTHNDDLEMAWLPTSPTTDVPSNPATAPTATAHSEPTIEQSVTIEATPPNGHKAKALFSNLDELNYLYQTSYMKYNAVHLIPNDVVDEIFIDIQNFIKINNRDIIEKITYFSNNCPELTPFAQQLIDHINIVPIYDKVHKSNHTDLARLTWKKQTKMYVEPIQIDLSLENNDKFHYVPILENLKALLSNIEINKAFFQPKNYPPDRITCFESGEKFKNSEFFKTNKNAIQIKLFVDALATTNVLGDSCKLHKEVGVYYKINNFDIMYQTKNYFTQLAMLFDNNHVEKYGYPVIMKCLMDDLAILETVGIQIQDVTLFGTIIYVCADNLGANSICGLVESFNSNINGMIFNLF